MRTLPAWLLLLAVGCAGAGPYSYSRSYEPLDDEEPYVGQAMPYSYEDVRRDPDGHKGELLAWFGTVDTVAGQGGKTRVALSQRLHRTRHACSGDSDSTCRVTISPKVGGPFTALLEVQPEHRSGRDRIAPGSLLKVYGRVIEGFDDRGGPLLEVLYYRHFPAGTYVLSGATERMRR